MKVAIIEDELISARELESLLKSQLPDIELDATMESIDQAVSYFEQTQPDLVFMDIELADGNCFEIFSRTSVECPIIFTTAYDQFAVNAFEQNSIAYLLKPITSDKLEGALAQLNDMRTSMLQFSKKHFQYESYKSFFLVRKGSKLISLSTKEIQFFFSQNNIVFVNAQDGSQYLGTHTLNQLEELLDPNHFFRLNRQYIVHRTAIDHMKFHVKGQVKVQLTRADHSAIVSRPKTPKLKKWLGRD